MANLDESPLNEQRARRRLAANYAGMTDGELQRLAQSAESLTEMAWSALKDEMDRRDLKFPDDPVRERRHDIEVRELVTIRQFRDLPEALLAKGSLESAGIETVLTDDNIVRLDWFWSNLMGGVKLKVAPEDVEGANEILNQPIPEGFDVTGIGEYRQPFCPRCQSRDVTFQELNKPIAYSTLYIGVPVPLRRPAWRCHACNAEWEDDAG